MSLKRFCDRCNNQITSDNFTTITLGDQISNGLEYELCSNCRSDYNHWFRNVVREAPR